MPVTPVKPSAARGIYGIYGPPTAGKSRLALCLPESFGRIAYLATDEGAETLASIPEQYHSRIDPFIFTGCDEKLGIVRDCLDYVTTPWESDKPNDQWPKDEEWKGPYGTVVLDTASRLSYRFLDFAASDKMAMVGKKKGEDQVYGRIGEPGSDAFFQLANEGHYGAANSLMLSFIGNLVNLHPTMNIIIVCHEVAADAKSPVGGPGFAGRAIAKWLPGMCQAGVIRVKSEEETTISPAGIPSTTTKRQAWIAPHGTWIARKAENVVGGPGYKYVDLEEDPVNFWHKFLSTEESK